MSNTIPVKKMEAADPGLGFELDLSTRVPLNNSPLQVTLVVHDVYDHKDHRSVLTIDPPITDPLVAIVMPFGCAEYKAGNQYEIKLTVMYGTEELVNLDQTIYGQGGTFNYRVNRPYLPRLHESLIGDPDYKYLPSMLMAGEHLASRDGRFILRLDYDGKLALYDIAGTHPNTSTWTSNPASDNNSWGKYYAFLRQNSDLCVFKGSPETHSTNEMIWSAYQVAFDAGKGSQYPLNLPVYLEVDASCIILRDGERPSGTNNAKYMIFQWRNVGP